MFHYNPYEPFTTVYTEYTSSTTVPTYSLQQTLLSLADQQSRIHAQKEQLAAEERRLNRLRTATLRRLRAQRLREAIEEAEIEDIVQHVLERERDGDEAMRDAVMDILNDARMRKIQQGLPADRELYRLLKVREMFDPSPRGPRIQYKVPFAQSQPEPEFVQESFDEFVDTPVVDEVSPDSEHYDASTPIQYFPETPAVASTFKRGSRRNSVRRESQPTLEPHRPSVSTVTSNQVLQSFAVLRTKFQYELSSVPGTIRSDAPPTSEETRILRQHVTRLEEILNEVDAIALPESPENLAIARKARREIVTDIVAAIDGIERHIQPGTPTESAAVVNEVSSHENSDSEENAFIDMEIQRTIRETLARKKGEDVRSRERTVTIEDVPDAEY